MSHAPTQGGLTVPRHVSWLRSWLLAWRRSTIPLRYLLATPFTQLQLVRATRTRREAQAHLMRRSGRALSACGIAVVVDGTPPVEGEGCVLIYNESSFADVTAFNAVMWRYIDRCGAAEAYQRIPFTRAAFERCGIVLVPRGNRAATDRVLARMVDAVVAGERVAWGGEGRLSGREEVGRFKVGAGLIAIRSQAPLIPVAIRGGHTVLPLGSLRIRSGTIRIRFGDPLATAGLIEDDARALVDRARDAVTALHASLPA
jgi:1-acyl-sn-glycerol-3-phosphate acyltransferase